MPPVATDRGSFAAADNDDYDDDKAPKKVTSDDPFFAIVNSEDRARVRELLGEVAPRDTSKSVFFDRFVEADRVKLRQLFSELDPDEKVESRITASRTFDLADWVSDQNPSAERSAIKAAVTEYVTKTAKQTLANGGVAISDEPRTPGPAKSRFAYLIKTFGNEKKHNC